MSMINEKRYQAVELTGNYMSDGSLEVSSPFGGIYDDISDAVYQLELEMEVRRGKEGGRELAIVTEDGEYVSPEEYKDVEIDPQQIAWNLEGIGYTWVEEDHMWEHIEEEDSDNE